MKRFIRLEPGDRHTFTVERRYDLTFQNDVGGTETVPPGRYDLVVERTWDDYETGVRAAGRLVCPHDIAKLRALGTTPHEPKLPDWNPAKVYFSGEQEE